jgi:hypothetical protein
MFLLHLIPDAWLTWAVHAIVMSGIVITILGTIFSNVPGVSRYASIGKWIGIFTLVIGFYLEGGYGTEMEWRNRVAVAEAKVAKAEQESADVNSKLEVEINKKRALLEERRVIYKDRIKREIIKIDRECKLDPIVPQIHNEAATNPALKKETK